MTYTTSILDQVLALAQEQIANTPDFTWSDPLSVTTSGHAGIPYRALTLLIAGEPIAVLGWTSPEHDTLDVEFSQPIIRRAVARHAPYFALTNLRDTTLHRVPIQPGLAGDILHRYAFLQLGTEALIGALTELDRLAVSELVSRLLTDLANLQKDGQLHLAIPDAEYFVARLVKAVEVLKPAAKSALATEISLRPDFASALGEWATPQGIAFDLKSEAFIEAVIRQSIYRLLGKIIFYQSLRRVRPDLPELNLTHLDTSQVLPRLNACFARAHEIDYHAVFREAIIDQLPFPAAASSELQALVEDLNTRDFAHLPQDVVGAVFERLIPPEDRHALGQFFTPEPLVDLITGFCVRSPEDAVLDPTCGTGTFLIRAYDRLRTYLGVHNHSQLLSQLWGVDVAPFPAELATINLFRQNLTGAGNFPRIINDDFFAVQPGGHFRFPPLKADMVIQTEMDETIPQFDAIVGNFPYISADRIEQTQKNYKRDVIFRRLAAEWFTEYPDGFRLTDRSAEREVARARQQGIDLGAFVGKAEPDVSSSSDFYTYLFWHATAFLKPGGRMGIVTSNAWLDVGFGYGLQRFLLSHFKIIAILESRCEPWFEQAAVNTVVTILERCEDAAERDTHPMRFVKIKQPLSQLIPWDMRLDGLVRWKGIQGIVNAIDGLNQVTNDLMAPVLWEDVRMRVRSVRQGAMREKVEASDKTVKWGPYLRAPQVYFDLVKEAGDKFTLLSEIAPPTRGSLTGINEFYHIDSERLTTFPIEPEFLFPLLKSPGDSDRILIEPEQLDLKVFVCRMTKEELRQQGKLQALKYIEWGEQQVFESGPQAGMTWPHGPTVQGRKPGWYAIPEYAQQFGSIFISMAIGDRFITKYSHEPLIADNRLYYLSPQPNVMPELIAAVLNSTISFFLTEISGRVSLGDGALEIKVDDASNYLILPNILKFNAQVSSTILNLFRSLLARPIKSIFEEVEMVDRQALDRAVLTAMGVDSAVWLPRIYEGLTGLVRERIELGRMRNQTKRARTQKAASQALEDVLEEIVPNGPRRFPADFYSPAANAGGFRSIDLPESVLRYAGPMMGKEELVTLERQILQVRNMAEVHFILFAQAAGLRVAEIPEKPVECMRAVNDYRRYLRELRKTLYDAYFKRTLDQATAERLTQEAWKRYKLPIIAD